jgi:hypothetical protein
MRNLNMKFICTVIALVFLSMNSMAQVQIHRGDNLADYTCIYNINDNKIFSGMSEEQDRCLYVIENNKVYKGSCAERDKTNCLYTIKNDKIYVGNSTTTQNLVYSILGNKVYKGKSITKQLCLYTYENGKVLNRNSEDVFVSVDGDIELALLVCILEIDFIDFYEN